MMLGLKHRESIISGRNSKNLSGHGSWKIKKCSSKDTNSTQILRKRLQAKFVPKYCYTISENQMIGTTQIVICYDLLVGLLAENCDCKTQGLEQSVIRDTMVVY
jgi:hypothetical protein